MQGCPHGHARTFRDRAGRSGRKPLAVTARRGSVAAPRKVRETPPGRPQAPGGVPVPPEIPAELARPLWEHLRAFYASHRAAGGHIPPVAAAFLDQLRAYVAAQLEPPVADIPAPSADMGASSPYVSTEAVAVNLRVTTRHARRLMAAAGHTQPWRGVWRAEDVAAVVAARRRNTA